MDWLLHGLARATVAFLQALPLRVVARLGRAGGAIAWRLDARHRRAALKNLTLCFGEEMAPAEIRALAMENFRRIGENYASAVKTAMMSREELKPYVQFVGAEKILPRQSFSSSQSRIVAFGRFDNLEVLRAFVQL